MSIENFVGQEKIKRNAAVFIESAKKRKKPLDHVICFGPPGLGKTSFAQILAKEMGSRFVITSAPTITKTAEIASILANLKENDILFIDEIHRLHKNIEEMLYSAMENRRLDIMAKKSGSMKFFSDASVSVSIPLPGFTLIGATTMLGKISQPLLHRFQIVFNFEYYTVEELIVLLKKRFETPDFWLKIENQAYRVVAGASRGTPRLAINNMNRMLDFCHDKLNFSEEDAVSFLGLLGIDQEGLNALDRKYLDVIKEKFDGGPVGIETIAAGLEESVDTLENTVEPYLIRLGYLKKTSKGRCINLN